MNYRFAGQQRTISFGRWSELSLADACKRVIKARRQLSAGIDPSEEVKLGKIQASEEQRLIEQFVAHAVVETLAVTVLHRLARRGLSK